jgi:hypothetical protein
VRGAVGAEQGVRRRNGDTMAGAPYTPEQKADMLTLPYEAWLTKYPDDPRPREGWDWQRKRQRRLARAATGADNGEAEVAEPIPTPLDERLAEPDLDDLFDKITAVREAVEGLNRAHKQVSVGIDTDRPIGIVCFGDWHVGGRLFAEQLKRHVEIVATTPGLYCLIGGDVANNFLPTMKIAHAGLGDPKPSVQYLIARRLVQRIAHKIIAAGSGNHDAWAQQLADFDPYLAMLRDVQVLDIPLFDTSYIGEGGLVRVLAGDQEHCLYRKHRGRFSRLNVFHGHQVLLREPEFEMVDAVILEHFHRPAAGTWLRCGRRVAAIACGSYKQDEYARLLGLYDGGMGSPGLILWPNERRLMVTPDVEETAEILKLWWPGSPTSAPPVVKR